MAGRPFRILVLVLVAGLLDTVASCGPTGPSPSTDLPSGIYVDGATNAPHYYIDLQHHADDTLSGTIGFAQQDGQTSAVLTFTGTMVAGVATLKASNSTVISATYGPSGLVLGGCKTYLKLVTTNAGCSFEVTTSGL